MYMLLLQCFY